MSVKCLECEHFNYGDGTKECFICEVTNENISLQEKYKRAVAPMMLEFLDFNIPKYVKNLQSFDNFHATIILQKYILGMTYQEIADFHNLKNHTSIVRYFKNYEKKFG